MSCYVMLFYSMFYHIMSCHIVCNKIISPHSLHSVTPSVSPIPFFSILFISSASVISIRWRWVQGPLSVRTVRAQGCIPSPKGRKAHFEGLLFNSLLKRSFPNLQNYELLIMRCLNVSYLLCKLHHHNVASLLSDM